MKTWAIYRYRGNNRRVVLHDPLCPGAFVRRGWSTKRDWSEADTRAVTDAGGQVCQHDCPEGVTGSEFRLSQAYVGVNGRMRYRRSYRAS